MAIQIQIATDNGVNITFDRGKLGGTVAYRIWDDAGAALTVNGLLTNATVINKLASTEEGGANGCLSDLGAFLSARCRQVGFTLAPADAGDRVWVGTVQLDALANNTTTGTEKDTKNETQVGFTALEASIQAEAVDTWRTAPTYPSGSNIDAPTEIDIGGTKVDSGGEPISGFLAVARITVRNVVNGRPTVPTSYLNKRNSDSVTLGPYTFAVRTLLFVGSNISRVGVSTYEQTWDFAYDAGYHLRQTAKKSPSLEVEASAKGDTCGSSWSEPAAGENRYARCVYWKQPFPSTTAFGAGGANLGIVIT
jgi:hypothetical protein